MPNLDPDIVQRFTGQRVVLAPEAAWDQCVRDQTAFARAKRNHKLISRQLISARVDLARRSLQNWFANAPSRFGIDGWILMLGPACVLGLTISLCTLTLLGGRLISVLFLAVAPFALLLAVPVIFPRDRGTIGRKLAGSASRMGMLARDRTQTARMVEVCRQRYMRARRLFHGLTEAQQFPLSRLLAADFRRMSGPEFECFLADIFRFLGYAVMPTGRSGDQGVDLVVTQHGFRIAVQAKCYSNSVGNSAVQQVYTGKQLYQCERCVVVTASAFTRGAILAANAVGCRLIGGAQIPLLIRGRITLE